MCPCVFLLHFFFTQFIKWNWCLRERKMMNRLHHLPPTSFFYDTRRRKKWQWWKKHEKSIKTHMLQRSYNFNYGIKHRFGAILPQMDHRHEHENRICLYSTPILNMYFLLFFVISNEFYWLLLVWHFCRSNNTHKKTVHKYSRYHLYTSIRKLKY